MSLFLSTFENRIDIKGRVSLPASFRMLLERNNDFSGVVLCRSLHYQCIFGTGMVQMEHFTMFENKKRCRDELKTYILAKSRPLNIDVTGRIIIPNDLLEYAQIENRALFVGCGEYFQIWNPELFKVFFDKSVDSLRKSEPNMII